VTRVRVSVPATTRNLGPGLDCMALALELTNTIELAEVEHGVRFELDGPYAIEEMESSARLALKAITTVFRRAGYLPGGLRLRLESNIPPGDCLGGDAACLLGGAVAANILLGSPLTREDLLNSLVPDLVGEPHTLLAAQLGGLIICTGGKNDLSYVPVRTAPMTLVVILPSLTTDASAITLPQQVSLEDAVFNIGHAALVVQAISTGNLALLGRAMQDRLHEAAHSQAIPGYREMLDAAYKAGAAAAAISGTGPAMIAFAKEEHSQVAKAMARAYRKTTGNEARTWVLPIDTQGISISEMGMTSTEKPVPASDHPVRMNRPDTVPASSSGRANTASSVALTPIAEGQSL
jgi:homoserine kinase